MDFAEGGSLGDLMETSGQISEKDLKWWLPQMVEAIHWCHSLGFCHRWDLNLLFDFSLPSLSLY